MKLERIAAVVDTDLRVARRDGEQLLLTIGLPVLLLVFFSTVDVLPTGQGAAVDFLTPGILALAVISVSFVRLAIGLGFDRGFGAIRRFAVTPLTITEFIVAKFLGTIVLFGVQLVVLGVVALLLGWDPDVSIVVVPVVLSGLVAFASLGFVVAGLTEGLTALAITNTLYVVLLITSGLVFELERLPDALATVVKFFPSTALAELLRSTLNGGNGTAAPWTTLMVWTLAAPALATRLFRWD